MLVERDLIGVLLVNENAIAKVANIVSSEMFSDGFCAAAYTEILKCYESGESVDLVILTEKLANDRLPDVMVRDRLAKYMTDCGVSTNAVNYAKAIRDAKRARSVGNIINNLKPDGETIDEQIRSTITDLEKQLLTEVREKTVGEIARENRDLYFTENGKRKIFLGFESLDNAIGGIESGDVVIIAARPAVGKSALALQVISNMAAEGLRVGYFNLEMQEGQVYERLLASKSGIALSRIRLATNFLSDEKERFDRANEELMQQDKIAIYSGTKTVPDLKAEVKGKGYDVIVIDYLQLLRSGTSRGANRYAEVGDISRGIKDIAMSCNIPVIALSQLNRASEERKDKEPSMAELRESGDIEQDASAVLILWSPSQEDKRLRKIKVDKARQGSGITQELYFDGRFMRFSEWADADDSPFD